MLANLSSLSMELKDLLILMDIEQIEEVTVLKDPVSKALYGGRISNGIIMVTTKHGKSRKVSFMPVSKRHQMQQVYLSTLIPMIATTYNQALANDASLQGL